MPIVYAIFQAQQQAFDWGVVTSIASVAIALIALVFTFVESRRSRLTARAQLRAYVLIDKIKITQITSQDGIKVTTEIRNYGQTPAFDVRSYFRIDFEAPDLPSGITEPMVPRQPRSTSGLGPGQHVLAYMAQDVLEESDVIALYAGEVVLYLAGLIQYTDTFGITHETHVRTYLSKAALRMKSPTMSYCIEGNKIT